MTSHSIQVEYIAPAPVEDANTAQRRATDPACSAWVSASAGTGKTTVLTNRVLRLLLPKADHAQEITPPHKILCITFTKSAAAEMIQRIMDVSARWCMMRPEALESALTKLFGTTPTDAQYEAARALFSKLVDAPDGLRVMTIHSFCESLLKRFPLEAGLSPHFDVIEEDDSTRLLDQAVQDVFKNPAYTEMLRYMQDEESQFALTGLLKYARAGRFHLNEFYAQFPTPAARRKAIYTALDVSPESTQKEDAWITDALIRFESLLRDGGAIDNKRADIFKKFLAKNPEKRRYSDLLGCFFAQTSGNTQKPNNSLCADHPGLEEQYQTIGVQIFKQSETEKNRDCAARTLALLDLCQTILDTYQQHKQRQAQLDFDDLIHETARLLGGGSSALPRIAAWVHYKLDGGIDHVLVDEAQDTNRAQWQIIEALSDDFFSGAGRYADDRRTIFAVGDYKQSIYSFQGAEPDAFQDMQNTFARKVQSSGKAWTNVPLATSFRSTEPVLRVVDTCFAGPEKLALGLAANQDLTHSCARSGQAGTVTLWPLLVPEKSTQAAAWQYPVPDEGHKNKQAELADAIAQDIQDRCSRDEITPDQVMILMQRRSALVDHLVRALKRRNLPTFGVDRMVLQNHIAVKDLLAAARFALMPQDDLSFACLLKSPLVGLGDDDLMSLAFAKTTAQESYWSVAQHVLPPSVITWCQTLIEQAQTCSVYDFMARILFTPCPVDAARSGYSAMLKRLGVGLIDPVEEFLSHCLNAELEPGQSLQRFVHSFSTSEKVIKRQMDQGGSGVRIMTVHAAKGLQARLVYLPDVFESKPAQHRNPFLWPQQTGLAAPIILPASKRDRSTNLEQLLAQATDRAAQENQRLLYVAMTRAEDHLVVCGARPPRMKADAPNWHNQIESALKRLPQTRNLPTATGEGLIYDALSTSMRLIEERKSTAVSEKTAPIAAPAWLHTPIDAYEQISAVINPSKLEGDTGAALSPLQTGIQAQRFRRGNLVHKLLQILPDIAASDRAATARNWLDLTAPDLDAATRTALCDEILAILSVPDFAALFGPTSRAEVPIVGRRADGAIISGQVDRLVVTESCVQIIDYKTNRPAPMDLAHVPQAYLDQMQAYAELLRGLYPGRRVGAALLWTDGPKLLAIPI